MTSFATVNPATGQEIKQFANHSNEEVEQYLQLAASTSQTFASFSIEQRGKRFNKLAALLEERIETLAALMVQEMGKPVSQARGELNKCAGACRYYATHADEYLRQQPVKTEAQRSYVAFEPLGVILAIMPWNFPFWQVFRFAAPALMAGNVALLKHASNVPQCAIAIESLFLDAGFPEGVVKHLRISSEDTEKVLRDPRVQALTLTGSSRAGKAVAAIAGSVLKKAVLELGGTDALIVLADANIDEAVATGFKSRMQNNGQSCIAAKRFILEAPVFESFTEKFLHKVASMTTGDPMQEQTQLGPLARADLRDQLHDQVMRSVAAGARLITGGHSIDGPGFYYAPTILADVTPGMPAFDEELFGPVAALCLANNEAEAVALANESVYGLGATVFTQDRAKGERIARRLKAGSTFVNAMVRSDSRLPFGGIKESGLGRELSHFGMHEFVNIKTVWVD